VSSVGSMATGVIIRPVFAFARAADGMPELELAFEDRRVLCKRRASAVCRNNPALGPWAVTARRYSSKVARKVYPQRLHEGGWRARRGGHLPPGRGLPLGMWPATEHATQQEAGIAAAMSRFVEQEAGIAAAMSRFVDGLFLEESSRLGASPRVFVQCCFPEITN